MPGLGRGLGSLIPPKINKPDGDEITPAVSVVSEADQDKILHLSPAVISANRFQPRQDFDQAALADLARSIKEHGILQPLVVSRGANGYELITGERRWRAAQLAGLATVPVLLRQADEQKRLELALIENIQRQDLNPIELAKAYRRLSDEFNLTQEVLAKRLGKSEAVFANTMRYLNLPPDIQQALIEGRISEGHAKIIVGFATEAKQRELFQKIVANKMTVAAAAIETQKMGGTKAARIKENPADRDRLVKLQNFFNTKVNLKRKDRGGQIIVDFSNDDELAGIMKKIS